MRVQDGFYVTIEGIDGAGKSTLVDRLDLDATFVREPTEEPYGAAAREMTEVNTCAEANVLAMAADRADHLERTVKPALKTGELVVSDRGHDSTYAYNLHRLNRGDPEAWIDSLYSGWNVEPDLTVLLDVPVETALDRMSGEEQWANRAHLEAVHEHYRQMASAERFVTVDGLRGPEVVADEVADIIDSWE